MSAPYPPDPRTGTEPWRSPPPPPPPQPSVPHDELAATIAAHRELGPQYEQALVERLAYEVDRVVDAQTARRTAAFDRARKAASNTLTLAIVSLGCGIPISAISAGIAKLPGLIVAWGGIVGVNIAHAWASRQRR